MAPTASSISAWEYTSSDEEQGLEHEGVTFGPHEAERLAAGADEATDRSDTRLAHRLQQEPVGASLGGRRARHQEVGAIEPDGVDLLDRDELGDLDRAGVVVALERLELRLLDDDVLAFGHLPALHELVGTDLTIVRGAPALLLDRRQAFAVQQPERDVRLAGSRLGRRGKPDGDADEPEAQ